MQSQRIIITLLKTQNFNGLELKISICMRSMQIMLMNFDQQQHHRLYKL